MKILLFMNYLLIVNYIHKELKFIMGSFSQLMDGINEKHQKISSNIYLTGSISTGIIDEKNKMFREGCQNLLASPD